MKERTFLAGLMDSLKVLTILAIFGLASLYYKAKAILTGK